MGGICSPLPSSDEEIENEIPPILYLLADGARAESRPPGPNPRAADDPARTPN